MKHLNHQMKKYEIKHKEMEYLHLNTSEYKKNKISKVNNSILKFEYDFN